MSRQPNGHLTGKFSFSHMNMNMFVPVCCPRAPGKRALALFHAIQNFVKSWNAQKWTTFLLQFWALFQLSKSPAPGPLDSHSLFQGSYQKVWFTRTWQKTLKILISDVWVNPLWITTQRKLRSKKDLKYSVRQERDISITWDTWNEAADNKKIYVGVHCI